MPETRPSPIEPQPQPGRAIALWTGILGPAILWLCQFELQFALVPWACSSGVGWPIHLIFAVSVLLAAACGAAAWRAREGAPEYARFMAFGGAGLSGMFILTTVAQWITSVVLRPCI